MNNDVYWNKNEKIIGVVGVAPAATADFYSKLIRLTPVKKEWEHVRVIIDSNPKIPSRGRYLELGETDPVPYIRASIKQLHLLNASIIAIPCNTAHILYESYAKNLPVMVINMIEVTVDSAINAIGRRPFNAAVFASRLTQQHKLYENVFNKYDGRIIDTSAHQSEISALIEAVKQGQVLSGLQEKMKMILSSYSQADVFILGCTELSLLASGKINNVPIIDSNLALAEACLKLSNNDAFNQSNTYL